MGQDATVSGLNINAKMDYNKGSIQSAEQLNTIGRSLNLMSGSNGVNVNRGLDGGIEVEGDPFPFPNTSFGYQLGVKTEGENPTIDNNKVRIFSGNLWYYQASTTSVFWTGVTDLELKGVYDTTVDFIYAKFFYLEQEDAPQLTVINHTSKWDNPLADTDGIKYTLLYTFTRKGIVGADESLAYGTLEEIEHFGDIYAGDSEHASVFPPGWPDGGTSPYLFAWDLVSFGYHIDRNSESPDIVHINQGYVFAGQGVDVHKEFVTGQDFTITDAVMWVYVEYTYATKSGIIKEFASSQDSTDGVLYTLLYRFKKQVLPSTGVSTASLLWCHHIGDIYAPVYLRKFVLTSVTWNSSTKQLEQTHNECYLPRTETNTFATTTIATAVPCP